MTVLNTSVMPFTLFYLILFIDLFILQILKLILNFFINETYCGENYIFQALENVPGHSGKL